MIVLLIARSVKSWLVTLLIIIILCITQSLLAVCQGYTLSRGLGFTRLHEACFGCHPFYLCLVYAHVFLYCCANGCFFDMLELHVSILILLFEPPQRLKTNLGQNGRNNQNGNFLANWQNHDLILINVSF